MTSTGKRRPYRFVELSLIVLRLLHRTCQLLQWNVPVQTQVRFPRDFTAGDSLSLAVKRESKSSEENLSEEQFEDWLT